MAEVLREISWAFTSWRPQVVNLAKNAMHKTTRGSVLGWVWLFARPVLYVLCFWFALNIGLKAARVSNIDGITYMLWLSAGIFPWFFISNTLNGGSNLFKRYSYLVSRLKFPVALIPIFDRLGQLMIHLMLLVMLTVAYFVCGNPLDLHALQLPIMIVLMYVFAVGWCFLASSLSAIAPGFLNLVKALSSPIFWLSGVLFDLTTIDIPIVHAVLYFNPVTFLISGYRQIFVNAPGYKGWLWDDPMFLAAGLGVIALTVVVGLIVYSRLRKDIPDVI